jgi:hypothetical protein
MAKKKHQAPPFTYWIVRQGSEKTPGPYLWLPHSRTHRWTTSDHLAIGFSVYRLAELAAARAGGFVVAIECEPIPTDAIALRLRDTFERSRPTGKLARVSARNRRTNLAKRSAPLVPGPRRAVRRTLRAAKEVRAGRADYEAAQQ